MPAGSIGEEISQLQRHGPATGPQKGRKYSHQQAIAAALSMARQGDFGKSEQKKAIKSQKRRKKKKPKSKALENLKRVVNKFRPKER